MIKLYYAPGACSLAPHILLEEAGIAFEPCPIDLARGDQSSPDYLAINPRGRVPVLVVDGEVLTEVPALLTYIAGLVPGAGLAPLAGTIEYARCFEWLAFLSSSVHIGYAQFRRPGRFLPSDAAGEDAFVEQGRLNTRALYLEIEERVGEQWLLGSRYRMADAYLLPFYLWGPRLGFDMTADLPRWTAWKDRMIERPAVRRALEREGMLVQLQPNG